MRRRGDGYYIRSLLATIAFYAAVLALLAAAGWWALAATGAFLTWVYFRAERWPPKVDVERLAREEAERHGVDTRSSR